MPTKKAKRSIPATIYYKNVSFETLVISWLTYYGWEVFTPIIDHDMKTDLLVGDGETFYRIQIKTIESNDESHIVENKWGDSNIDYVIYFSKTSNWGYIAKPFNTNKKRINDESHIRFHQNAKTFIKAFNRS